MSSQTQPTTSTSNTTTTTTSAATSSRPPVTLPPSTHLDPGAYIRGTHPIALGENNLIHPRALLTTTTHPLIIGSNNVISEKASIGGCPFSPPSTGSSSITAPTASSASGTPTFSAPSTPQFQPPSPNPSSTHQHTSPTTLHSNIHIAPAALISHSAVIHSYTTIDSHAVIYPGVTVGEHSKVCAGVHVRRDVPGWCVVWGEGTGGVRRSRKPKVAAVAAGDREIDGDGGGEVDGSEADGHVEKKRTSSWQAEALQRIDEAEAQRVKGTEREREAATILLRNAARAAVAAKRASVQR